MKTLLLLFLIQHAVVSAKAGFITYTAGGVDVQGRKHIGENGSLTTDPSGRAEFMLNPDTYMRILGDTRLVLESESLDRISVRLIRGAAVVDAAEIDKDMPILIHAGELEILIVKRGLYFIEENQIYVLDGEARIDGSDTTIKKDRFLSLTQGAGVAESKPDRFDEPPSHPLLLWNQRRSAEIERPRRSRRLRGFGGFDSPNSGRR